MSGCVWGCVFVKIKFYLHFSFFVRRFINLNAFFFIGIIIVRVVVVCCCGYCQYISKILFFFSFFFDVFFVVGRVWPDFLTGCLIVVVAVLTINLHVLLKPTVAVRWSCVCLWFMTAYAFHKLLRISLNILFTRLVGDSFILFLFHMKYYYWQDI